MEENFSMEWKIFGIEWKKIASMEYGKIVFHSNPYHALLVSVITFYLPSCLGQETAKGPFGLRVKLPPAHLSTTHGGGFTLSLLMLNVKQETCEYQFL